MTDIGKGRSEGSESRTPSLERQKNSNQQETALERLNRNIRLLRDVTDRPTIQSSEEETHRKWCTWLEQSPHELQAFQKNLQDYRSGVTAIVPSDRELRILRNQIYVVSKLSQDYCNTYQRDEPNEASYFHSYPSLIQSIKDEKQHASDKNETEHLGDYQVPVFALAKFTLDFQKKTDKVPDPILSQFIEQIERSADEQWGIALCARRPQDLPAISFPDIHLPKDPYVFNLANLEGANGVKTRLRDINKTALLETQEKLKPAMEAVDLISKKFKSTSDNLIDDSHLMKAYRDLRYLGMSRELTLTVKEYLTKITGRVIKLDPDKLSPQSRSLYQEIPKLKYHYLENLIDKAFNCKNPNLGYSRITQEIAADVYNNTKLVKGWYLYLTNEGSAALSNNPLEAIYAWEDLKSIKETAGDLGIAPSLKSEIDQYLALYDS